MKKIILSLITLFFAVNFAFSQKENDINTSWEASNDHIMTVWGENINPNNVWQEYPRPQLVRQNWKNLNGLWEYAITHYEERHCPTTMDGKILVPFAVESALSGVTRRITPLDAIWYRTETSIPTKWKNNNIIIHFDAVDYQCQVWINGHYLGIHRGGYTAFQYDITPYLNKDKNAKQQILVKVIDCTDNNRQTIGKQRLNPKGIYYTPVSGIWQTVWLEPVSPNGYISDYKIQSDIEKSQFIISPTLINAQENDVIKTEFFFQGKKISEKTTPANTNIIVDIDDAHLWTPSTPNIYDFSLTLSRQGKILDHIESYSTMRKISVKRDAEGHKRLALNDEILFQFGPLDQGWWPDGLYTAPCDEALRFDIEKTKELGFNMIRKHIKVEPSRWYMWADRLGVLVWQDMPTITNRSRHSWSQEVYDAEGNNFYDSGTDPYVSDASKELYYREWAAIINQLDKFQCITTWVPFNESWAQFDTQKVVDFTRSLDPTRLVDAASGGNWWRGQMGDMLDSHHYPNPKMRIIDTSLVNVLGEFGGIGLVDENHLWKNTKDNWGYVQYKNSDEATAQYVEYAEQLAIIAAEICAAAVYTQTTDVEMEVNGLMTYDRKVMKMNTEQIRKANEMVIMRGSDVDAKKR